MKETDVIWSNAAGVFDNTVAESTISLLLAQLHAHRYVNDTFSSYEEVQDHKTYLHEDKTVAIIGAFASGMLAAPWPPISASTSARRWVAPARHTPRRLALLLELLTGLKP